MLTRKLLYTTILASVVATSSICAEPLSATVGGLIDFHVAKRTQDAPYGNDADHPISPNNKELRFNSNASVVIKAEGKADVGIEYGGIIKINPTVGNRHLKDAVLKSLDQKNKSYIYMGGEFGMLQLGSNDSAGYILKVGGEDLALGTGGVGYLKFVNTDMPRTGHTAPSTVVFTNNVAVPAAVSIIGVDVNERKSFIQMPMLMSDYLEASSGKAEGARKVTYFTPSFQGFRAGASYTPDSLNHGDGDFAYNAASPEAHKVIGSRFFRKQTKNALSGGVYYDYDLDNIKVTASWVADYAPTKIDNVSVDFDRNKLNSWNLGGKISYAGFSAAGSYGRWNKSLSPTTAVIAAATAGTAPADYIPYQAIRDDSDYWTAAGSYNEGPVGVSVAYFKSTFDKNVYKTLSVAAEYQLVLGGKHAPALMPYAEVTYFKQTPHTTWTGAGFVPLNLAATNTAVENTRTNSGTVFMLGTKVAF